MNKNILDLTHKYFSEQNFHSIKVKLVYDRSGFLNFYNQIGGEELKTTINDVDYYVDYHENINSDQTLVYINNTKTKDVNKSCCAMLSYSDNINIHIEVIEDPINCIYIRQQYDDKINYGDIMIKIILDFAKKKGFKTVTLDDDSKYFCKGYNKYNYYLKYGNVLTHGEPWYYKYGFVYIDDNHNIVNHNKRIINELKVSELPFEIIVMMIIKYTKSPSDKIFDIAKLYHKYKTENITKFMFELSRYDCVIFTAIHKKIFKILNLKKYDFDERIKMILHL